jgi:tRNA(Ile)-lysidine synthase
MAVAKKLQDFMVDDKIPREWRDRVPLVVSPRGIVWVVGWRIADWARVKSTGGRRLEMRFSNVG